jgi:hypothetical protein
MRIDDFKDGIRPSVQRLFERRLPLRFLAMLRDFPLRWLLPRQAPTSEASMPLTSKMARSMAMGKPRSRPRTIRTHMTSLESFRKSPERLKAVVGVPRDRPMPANAETHSKTARCVRIA